MVACGIRPDRELACAAVVPGVVAGEEGEEVPPLPAVPAGVFVALSVGGPGGCAIRATGELARWDGAADLLAASWPVVLLEVLPGSR